MINSYSYFSQGRNVASNLDHVKAVGATRPGIPKINMKQKPWESHTAIPKLHNESRNSNSSAKFATNDNQSSFPPKDVEIALQITGEIHQELANAKGIGDHKLAGQLRQELWVAQDIARGQNFKVDPSEAEEAFQRVICRIDKKRELGTRDDTNCLTVPLEEDHKTSQREVRSGDWECVECNYTNFEGRTSCNKCKKRKPIDAPLTTTLKNWECSICCASNHSRRQNCFKCRNQKGKDAKTINTLSDWFCPNCSKKNAARRTNCSICDSFRPGREEELEKCPDWKCRQCGIFNWSWREVCYKCHNGIHDEL